MASNNEHKIICPFFQVKSAGQVIEHTNSEEAALKILRDVTKPGEMWRIHANGSADLIRRTLY